MGPTRTTTMTTALGALRMRYAAFVVRHAAQVASAEGSVRSLTYMLPGRFQHAGPVAETIFAAVSLAAMYHDAVLARAAAHARPEAALSCHAARLRAARDSRDAALRVASRILAVVRVLECSFEMLANVIGGRRGQLRSVIAIETVKLLCRLILFVRAKRRMVLTGLSAAVAPSRNYDVADVQAFVAAHDAIALPAIPSSISPNPIPALAAAADGPADSVAIVNGSNDPIATGKQPTVSFADAAATNLVADIESSTWRGTRTHREYLSVKVVAGSPAARQTIPLMLDDSPRALGDDPLAVDAQLGPERHDHTIQYLLARAVVELSTITAFDLLPSLAKSPSKSAAELLYLFRPLVYSVMLYRCGTRSWKPWVTSLIMELSALIPLLSRTRPSVARAKVQKLIADAYRSEDGTGPEAIVFPDEWSSSTQKSSGVFGKMYNVIHGTVSTVGTVVGKAATIIGSISSTGDDDTIPETLTPLEWQEYQFRIKILLLYLIRSPFYEKYTEERLSNIIDSGRKRLLLSIFVNILADYKPLWESWYYYKNGY